MNRDIDEIVNNIDKWSLPSKDQMLDYLNKLKADNKKAKREPISKAGYYWSITESINPLQMYLYLKARFGNPNGLAMAVKNKNTSDNLVHWEYMLTHGKHVLMVTGFNFHFNILISEVSQQRKEDKELAIKAIKKDFGVHRAQMDKAFKALETWYLFINPYYHYSDMVHELFEKLRRTKLAKASSYSRPSSIKDFESLNEVTKNLHEAFSTGTMLKLLIPIWLESYINLIFILMMKDHIRNDKHLFEEKKRQPIIKKIKTLHIDCKDFVAPVTDNELKSIKTIFKNRNRFLHGSFDPKYNPLTTIYFDLKYIPLMNLNTYSPHLTKNLLLNEVNEDLLDREITTGEEFILTIFSKIHPQASGQLKQLTHENFPGWEKHRKILGCVLPSQFGDLFHPDDSENQRVLDEHKAKVKTMSRTKKDKKKFRSKA